MRSACSACTSGPFEQLLERHFRRLPHVFCHPTPHHPLSLTPLAPPSSCSLTTQSAPACAPCLTSLAHHPSPSPLFLPLLPSHRPL